jgi:adhesin transport system membrane fusion protein
LQTFPKYQDELSSQTFKLDERKSVLFHTELIAPVDGVVKTLRLNTVGGVLRAGDELMQISPTQVDLILEAKVSPSDVGLLQVGLPASVRIDAFDYTIYGALEGTLNYISSDTILEQSATGQSTANYKVRVNFDKNLVHPKIDINELRPGMTASVDIRTNSRSVLVYLFKPIARAFQGVASQR